MTDPGTDVARGPDVKPVRSCLPAQLAKACLPLGDKPVVEVDTDILPLAPDDRIIVCSDGLWEMVRDEGIRDVMMQEADPQTACDLFVRHANVAGGDDNISVIIVRVETN